MDHLYYALTPLVSGYKYFAGTLFAVGFMIHWIRGAYAGSVKQDFKTGMSWWKTSILSLLIYTICYVPVPNPGSLIGLNNEVNVSQTAYGRTTLFIFLIERLSVGFDHLTIDMLGWDLSIKSQTSLKTRLIKSKHGKFLVEELSATEKMENFIRGRGDFLFVLSDMLWKNDDLREKGVESNEESTGLGSFDILDMLSEDQIETYLKKQLSGFIYSLGSLILVIITYILLIILGLIVYLIAGIVKYVPIFLAGTYLFLLPFAWIINGRKALNHAITTVLVYLPLKTVLALQIWLAFFVIEAIIIQGYIDLADSSLLISQLESIESGYLFTPAGLDFLTGHEMRTSVAGGIGQLGVTLVSIIVALLAMIYVILRSPGIVSSMLARHGAADDMITTVATVATSIYAGGVALMNRARQGDDDVSNLIQGGQSGSS